MRTGRQYSQDIDAISFPVLVTMKTKVGDYGREKYADHATFCRDDRSPIVKQLRVHCQHKGARTVETNTKAPWDSLMNWPSHNALFFSHFRAKN